MGLGQNVAIFQPVGQGERENLGQFVDFQLDFQDQGLQLLVEMMAVVEAGLQQLGQGGGLAIGKEPGEELAHMQDLGQRRLVLTLRRMPGDGIAKRIRKAPLLQQAGGKLRV